jgi:hypothetical protein
MQTIKTLGAFSGEERAKLEELGFDEDLIEQVDFEQIGKEALRKHVASYRGKTRSFYVFGPHGEDAIADFTDWLNPPKIEKFSNENRDISAIVTNMVLGEGRYKDLAPHSVLERIGLGRIFEDPRPADEQLFEMFDGEGDEIFDDWTFLRRMQRHQANWFKHAKKYGWFSSNDNEKEGGE